jgi:hypothetical protein
MAGLLNTVRKADYETAVGRAQEEGKPLLAVMVAGKIDGYC